jgi:hypothetical protein
MMLPPTMSHSKSFKMTRQKLFDQAFLTLPITFGTAEADKPQPFEKA